MDQLVLECQGRVPSKLPSLFHERRQTVNAAVNNPQDLYNAVQALLAADTVTACILLLYAGWIIHLWCAPLHRDAKCSREPIAAAEANQFFQLACTVLQHAQEQHIEPVRKECTRGRALPTHTLNPPSRVAGAGNQARCHCHRLQPPVPRLLAGRPPPLLPAGRGAHRPPPGHLPAVRGQQCTHTHHTAHRSVVSKMYSAAAPLVDRDYFETDPRSTQLDARDVLLFSLYGSMVCIGTHACIP